jgi:hypothetical protein
VDGVPEKLVGNPQGIARDGRWALATRSLRDGASVELARAPLARGVDELVLARGELAYAELLEGDDEAVLVGTSRETGAYSYDRLGVHAPGDRRGVLRLAPHVISMALVKARR